MFSVKQKCGKVLKLTQKPTHATASRINDTARPDFDSAVYIRFIAFVVAIPLRILLPPQRPVNPLVSLHCDVEREAERARLGVNSIEFQQTIQWDFQQSY